MSVRIAGQCIFLSLLTLIDVSMARGCSQLAATQALRVHVARGPPSTLLRLFANVIELKVPGHCAPLHSVIIGRAWGVCAPPSATDLTSRSACQQFQAAGHNTSNGRVSTQRLELNTGAISLDCPRREMEEHDSTTTVGLQAGDEQKTNRPLQHGTVISSTVLTYVGLGKHGACCKCLLHPDMSLTLAQRVCSAGVMRDAERGRPLRSSASC